MIFSERVDLIHRVQDLFYNEERTFGRIPTFSYQGALGTGGGLTLFHTDLFDRRHAARLSFLVAERFDFSVRASYQAPIAGGEGFYPLFAGVESLVHEDSNEDFFTRLDPSGRPVYGTRAIPENRASYLRNRADFAAFVARRLPAHLNVRAEAGASLNRTSRGRLLPAVPAAVPGMDGDAAFLGGGGSLAWDRRDHADRAVSGQLLEAKAFARQDVRESRFGFAEYSAQAQQFFPLPWGPYRTFLVRGAIERVDRLGDREVPFYVFRRLDQNHGLRGYERNRFQDRGTVVFNLEYRYPIWRSWDAVWFLDHGMTYGETRDIYLPAFMRSYGAAVRFLSENRFLFLIQFGVGGQDSEVTLSLQQAF